jgi:hypothetical protein
MKRPLWIIVAAGLVAGPTACGPKGDPYAGVGDSISAPTEVEPTASADTIVDGIGGLQDELARRVLAAAGIIRPYQAHCEVVNIDLEPVFPCTITVLDEVVTYQVKTKPGNYYSDWTAEPDALVATRVGIEAAVWRRYASKAKAIRCDADLPEKQRVPPGQTLGQHCYVTPTAQDSGFGADSGNHGRTYAIDITLYDGRLDLTERTA